MSKLYKSWEYFLCPVFLGLGVLYLFMSNYLQAQIEFLWALIFLVIMRTDAESLNGSSITIEIPKGVMIDVSSCGSGGSNAYGHGHKFEEDASRPFGFKCVKCGFKTGSGGGGGVPKSPVGGGGSGGKVCFKKFSKLPPPGPMTEGEYKAWCDWYEIKE